MKGFIVCGILCIIAPILWWCIFCAFETPKSENVGLSFACIAAWIINEILLVLTMCFIVHNDEGKLKDFFDQ